MTNKGAIDILRIILREATECEDSISYVTDIDSEPLRLAIKALEKQIPKKPNYVPDDDTCVYYHWECPECGNYYSYSIRKTFSVLYNNSVSYCSRCGQAIDWSED